MNPTAIGLVMHCRAGFENEAAAEISECAAAHGLAIWCRAKSGQGWLSAHGADDHQTPERLVRRLRLHERIFIRDWFVGEHLCDLAAGDRVDPIVRVLGQSEVNDVWLSGPDTAEGRAMNRLCKQLRGRVTGALQTAGKLVATSGQGARALFVSGSEVWAGRIDCDNASPWLAGIPRLKLGGAPSRSAAKLDEAFMHFLGPDSAELLSPGMRAVDLGAAPGGWSWQFARRSIHVTAVDHGALRDDLQESAMVDYRPEDAFRFQPSGPVDWLVCDIVDKPARVAGLMTRWLKQGWCRHAMFNLKLPMKKRFEEVTRLLAGMQGTHHPDGRRWALNARQLYHDREEVTVYARLSGR